MGDAGVPIGAQIIKVCSALDPDKVNELEL